jgi:hypothetical protein
MTACQRGAPKEAPGAAGRRVPAERFAVFNRFFVNMGRSPDVHRLGTIERRLHPVRFHSSTTSDVLFLKRSETRQSFARIE